MCTIASVVGEGKEKKSWRNQWEEAHRWYIYYWYGLVSRPSPAVHKAHKVLWLGSNIRKAKRVPSVSLSRRHWLSTARDIDEREEERRIIRDKESERLSQAPVFNTDAARDHRRRAIVSTRGPQSMGIRLCRHASSQVIASVHERHFYFYSSFTAPPSSS